MNANEFIKHLENSSIYEEYGDVKDAVDMLRQQQAEIEALQKECDYWNTLAIERAGLND